MTAHRTAAIALVSILVVAGGFIARERATSDAPGADSTTGTAFRSAFPEPIEPPVGDYDPPQTQPVPPGRAVPPDNKLVNDRTGEPGASVQSEVGIWVDGDDVVIGWNDSRGFAGVGSNSGVGYSRDRGETWTDGGSMPETATIGVLGDPTIVKTNAGTWVYASIGLNSLGDPSGLAVNRGEFISDVLTWNPPIRYGAAFLDKEYLDYDPTIDRIYMAYNNINTGNTELTWSDTDGLAWASPRLVVDGFGSSGPYPVVGIDGGVYVSWAEGDPAASGTAFVRYSSNGGSSWSTGINQIATMGFFSGENPQCFNRDRNLRWPSVEVDRSDGQNRGRLHASYVNGAGGEFNIYYKYSDNHGASFQGFKQLNDNTPSDDTEQFFPTLSVGPDGRVTVGWYDRRNDAGGTSLCDFYVTQSVDGGVTFGPNRRMSDMSVAWCGVPADAIPNFGDYNDMDSDERSVFAAWSDAREGNPDVIFSRFDDVHTLSVTGDIASVAPFAASGTAWFIPNEAEIRMDPPPAVDSNAQLAVGGLALGFLATPAEDPGVFQIGGEDISGAVTLTATEGTVTGTFAIVRTGTSDIDFDFTAESDAALGGIAFTDSWSGLIGLTSTGPGTVEIAGDMTLTDGVSDYVFAVSGTMSLNGIAGTFTGAQELDHTASVEVDGSALVLHTRTLVEGGIVVAVEPLEPPTNPFPFVALGASPNPYKSSTKIHYELDRPTEGSLRLFSVKGQLVRTIAEGAFEAGRHEYAFDARSDDGSLLASGAYFIRFDTRFGSFHSKLFILR